MAAAQAVENYGDERDLCPDIYGEVYIHQIQSAPTYKIHKQQQIHWASRYAPMEHLSYDHKDRPN